MKSKSFHVTKNGLAQPIAAELGRVFQCVCDKLPPAYPCDGEKLIFVGIEMNGKLDITADTFLKNLTPARTKNVAIYVINATGSTEGLDKITAVLEEKGVHVAGKPLGIAVKSGLFKKGNVTQEDIDATIEWANNLISSDLA